MMVKKSFLISKYKLTVFLLLFSFAFLSSLTAYTAEDDKEDDKAGWEYHRGQGGTFEVRFPRDYKQKIKSLRLDDESVIYSSEIIATTGEHKNPRKNKVFLIKVEQSYGDPFSAKMIKSLLKSDVNKYLRSMKRSGGVLRTELDTRDGPIRGKELLITFNEGNEKQALRVRIMYSDHSKIQQVLSGPASSMYAYRSNDFFESLKVYSGISREEGKVGEDWERHVSPHGIATIVVPPAQEPFTSGPLKFQTKGKMEKASMTFEDPILNYKTYYNVYGYQLKKNLDVEDIRSILYSQHVAKYGVSTTIDSIKLRVKREPDKTIVYTKLLVPPSMSQPYSNTVFLQAQFRGKYVVIQEVRGSMSHALSPLMKSIVGLLEFHPRKAGNYAKKKKQATASSSKTDETELDETELDETELDETELDETLPEQETEETSDEATSANSSPKNTEN